MRSLRVEEVWANSVSCSFKSLKNNSVAVLSKVYAGDILTANIGYAPINVSDKNKNAVLKARRTSHEKSFAVLILESGLVNTTKGLKC